MSGIGVGCSLFLFSHSHSRAPGQLEVPVLRPFWKAKRLGWMLSLAAEFPKCEGHSLFSWMPLAKIYWQSIASLFCQSECDGQSYWGEMTPQIPCLTPDTALTNIAALPTCLQINLTTAFNLSFSLSPLIFNCIEAFSMASPTQAFVTQKQKANYKGKASLTPISILFLTPLIPFGGSISTGSSFKNDLLKCTAQKSIYVLWL